jgi:4a-hydroxytetrahydrobiopterin dehydratase
MKAMIELKELKFSELTQSKCKPCEAGVPPLNSEQLQLYREDPNFNWAIIDEKKIEKDYHFDSYGKTIEFVNKVAYLAEDEGHHPVMHVFFNKVSVELWTHAIDGLSENDFILAAKIDEIHV